MLPSFLQAAGVWGSPQKSQGCDLWKKAIQTSYQKQWQIILYSESYLAMTSSVIWKLSTHTHWSHFYPLSVSVLWVLCEPLKPKNGSNHSHELLASSGIVSLTLIVAIPICLAVLRFTPKSSRNTASSADTPSFSKVRSKIALSGFLRDSTHDSTTCEHIHVDT